MSSLYGHAWTSSYGDDSRGMAGREWATTLAGLSRLQIDLGLQACRIEGREFPPSAPRFRGMCLGIPEFEAVRVELTKPEAERSPFTRLAWSHVDGYRHRHSSVRDADGMLRAGYNLAVEHLMRGDPLPGVLPAIEPPQRSLPVGIPETREGRIERLRKVLGDQFNPLVEDPSFEPTVPLRKLTTAEEREAAEAELRASAGFYDIDSALDEWRAEQESTR